MTSTPVARERRTLRALGLTGIVLVLLATAAPAARSTEAGAPVQGFGTGGVVAIDLPGDNVPTAMVKTTTGKLVVTIQSGSRLFVAMLTSDGDLDSGFGDEGIAALDLASTTIGAGLQPSPTGAVLVAAWLRDDPPVTGEQRLAVARLGSDGALDASYGDGGVASTLAGELTPVDHAPGGFAASPDGSAVVLGVTGAGGYYGGAAVAALVRFTADGERDASFGADGLAPLAPAGTLPLFGGLAIAPDGGILVGETSTLAGPIRYELLVRRFTPYGAPDLGFGAAGVAQVPIPGDWRFITDVKVDDVGRIVCYGYTAAGIVGSIAGRVDLVDSPDPSAGFSPAIARLHPDGRPDVSFGRGGVMLLYTDGDGVPLLWSGNIAVTRAGAFVTAYEDGAAVLTTRLLAVDATGAVDHTFGAGHSIRLPMENTMAVVAFGDRVVVLGERSWSAGGTLIAAFHR
ncbi:MAG TPA: hypothetical protein VM262_07560 [Acidimicrobiales bacterium]|nr:hypothetical protein [Acidimicrobiales bacterium]